MSRPHPFGRRSIEPCVNETAMTCRELVDFLDDYLAGILTANVRGRFEAHLTECRDCVVYLRGYRDSVRLLRESGRDLDAEVPADVPDALLVAIRAARTPGRAGR